MLSQVLFLFSLLFANYFVSGQSTEAQPSADFITKAVQFVSTSADEGIQHQQSAKSSIGLSPPWYPESYNASTCSGSLEKTPGCEVISVRGRGDAVLNSPQQVYDPIVHWSGAASICYASKHVAMTAKTRWTCTYSFRNSAKTAEWTFLGVSSSEAKPTPGTSFILGFCLSYRDPKSAAAIAGLDMLSGCWVNDLADQPDWYSQASFYLPNGVDVESIGQVPPSGFKAVVGASPANETVTTS